MGGRERGGGIGVGEELVALPSGRSAKRRSTVCTVVQRRVRSFSAAL